MRGNKVQLLEHKSPIIIIHYWISRLPAALLIIVLLVRHCTDECTFSYIQHNNMYMVDTTRKNSNIAMLFTLLHKICQVMQEVEEESIRDNFVFCYELMDELIDFGYPQTTDAKILQEYITQVQSKV